MIALAGRRGLGYDIRQVLETLRLAVPRADDAVFLCLPSFASLEVGLVRKAGRMSSRMFRTTSASAFESAESVSTRSHP